MTDKEIIIDGVNVAGCYFCKNSFELTDFKGIQKCSDIRDCFYKQLQRKTQECEELKEELSTYKKMLDNPEVRIALTDIRTGERDIWRKLGNKANRYKQALEKIDNIVTSAGYGIEDKSVMAIIEPILKTINEVKK